MAKPKILFIVGAGASIQFGIPDVSAINISFSEWSREFCSSVLRQNVNLYEIIREEVNLYYAKNPKPSLAEKTNFEEILFLLFYLSAITDDPQFYNPLAATCSVIPKVMINAPVNPFSSLAGHLVDELLKQFRRRCLDVKEQKKEEFDLLINFFATISSRFDIGFVSLNYDDLISQARPDLFTGFDEQSGEFRPELVYDRGEWNFLYQIHGSVHFDMVQGRGLHDICWRQDLNSRFQPNSVGRNRQETMEGIYLPTSSIVAGYSKLDQIQRDPFRTYFCELDRLAFAADAVVFLGYGFGDFHINRTFRNIRRVKPAKKVVVITFEKDDGENPQDPLAWRRDDWSCNLFGTIPFNADDMTTRQYSIPPDIAQLKEDREFEVSRNPDLPLSIWYGGFLEACKHVDRVMAELG